MFWFIVTPHVRHPCCSELPAFLPCLHRLHIPFLLIFAHLYGLHPGPCAYPSTGDKLVLPFMREGTCRHPCW